MSYPPGIPILAPGERITPPIVEYIQYAKAKGCLMTGPENLDVDLLNVVKEGNSHDPGSDIPARNVHAGCSG